MPPNKSPSPSKTQPPSRRLPQCQTASPRESRQSLTEDLRQLLLAGEATTQEQLCAALAAAGHQVNQSKVSRHLAQLRNCALLQDRRQRQWVYYSLHPDLPAWTLPVLDLAAEAEAARLRTMRDRLHAMNKRPERIVC